MVSPKGPRAHSASIGVYAVVAFLLTQFAILYSTQYLGLLMIASALLFFVLARRILFGIFSINFIFLSVAFDYYIRVRPDYFLFYDGSGYSVQLLAFANYIILLLLFVFDSVHENSRFQYKFLYVPRMDISFNLQFALASSAVLMLLSAYIFLSQGVVVGERFDFDNLQRFSWLEYFSILSIILSYASYRSSIYRYIFLSVNIIFFFVLLLASYRLAATIVGLVILIGYFDGKRVSKLVLLATVLLVAVAFSAVGYLRAGKSDFSTQAVLGYKDLPRFGMVMDNTYTGVIETSLQYTSMKENAVDLERDKHLLGVLAPFPGRFLPMDYHYIDDIKREIPFRVPGGGTIGGFVLYFDYLLLVPLFLVWWMAHKLRGSVDTTLLANGFWSSVLYVVCTATLMRWSLYGPYVIFNFLGVIAVIYFFYRLLPVAGMRRSPTFQPRFR